MDFTEKLLYFPISDYYLRLIALKHGKVEIRIAKSWFLETPYSPKARPPSLLLAFTFFGDWPVIRKTHSDTDQDVARQ